MSKSNHGGGGGGGGVHLLMFPYPAQGHMPPMLDLAHELALRAFSLTILVTPKNLQTLDPLLSTHPNSIHTLILPFPSHPSLPPGVENVSEVGNAGNRAVIAALSKLHQPLAQWFASHPNPPIAIISSFFLGWTQRLARNLGIPRIAFYPTGAFLISVFNYLWMNLEAIRSLPAVHFIDLPRSPVIKEHHFPPTIRASCATGQELDPDLQDMRDGIIENMSSWGSIFNSFHSLEGEYLDHFKKTHGTSRVWGVGPLNKAQPKPIPDNMSDVMSWLIGCTDGSVLYVCFGSQKLLNKSQMAALASGLEQSGVKFIWVVKPAVTRQQADDGYGLIPSGFEDRVSNRGVVIKGWAPQTYILNHRAIGGFLSHCGWNSVMDSVLAGVMILGWPMEGDQFINERLMVEQLGAAVHVCEGAGTVPDSSEIGKIITEAMEGCSPEKLRAKEMRMMAVEAVKVGGSSWKDLEGLVDELKKLKN